jgi:hypothetical protein
MTSNFFCALLARNKYRLEVAHVIACFHVFSQFLS